MTKKPARTFVIDQDEHLQNLRKIIKRDFFGDATADQKKDTLQFTLNDYISNYKSNQNQFFSEMVHVNNEQWKRNHWWIDKQDKMLMVTNNEKFLALPYHNMLGTDHNQNGINTAITKQEAKNSFFFNRQNNYGSLQNSEYQEAKKVAYNNCRLQDSVSQIKQKIGFVKHEEITPVRDPSKQWEGRGQLNKNDQAPVQTDDGPLMTWGDIESTPLRIAGPEFRIPETPQRQIILSNLNSKINKQKLQPPKKSEHVMKILGSLTPSFNSRNRLTSSIRRMDSIRRQKGGKDQKNDISGLLHIKK